MIRLRGVAVFLVCLALLVGCEGQPAFTQGLGSKIWVGRYQEIEEYLRTGECVRMEALAFNYTKRCTLRPGGPFARMAWRPLPPGVHSGFSESYRTEIATYELDKLLKMDMVPPSVERQIQGNKGAAQLWVENVVDGTDPTPPPPPEKVHWEAQVVRMTMFDSLIGNRDRNRRKHAPRSRVEPHSARSLTKLHGRHRAPSEAEPGRRRVLGEDRGPDARRSHSHARPMDRRKPNQSYPRPPRENESRTSRSLPK